MHRFHTLSAALALAALTALPAHAAPDRLAYAALSGYEEVPAVSTAAKGEFRARARAGEISYKLSYANVASGVTQAHIHFAQKGVNGGISVFLCSNLDAPDAGTQPCPSGDAIVTGTITAADVLGPTGQGLSPGEFEEFLDAMLAGITYANVHSVSFPGGEIRGQIQPR